MVRGDCGDLFIFYCFDTWKEMQRTQMVSPMEETSLLESPLGCLGNLDLNMLASREKI